MQISKVFIDSWKILDYFLYMRENQIHINHISEINKYQSFPFIVEVGAFEQADQSELWGASTEDEAREIIKEMTFEYEKWMAEDENADPEWRPSTKKNYTRPLPDEDNDIPDLSWWEEL